jgi:long-chain acyl-CoA synthetase
MGKNNLKPWLDHYDAHVPPELEYPNQSLVDLLSESCQKFPGLDCFVYQDIKITYSEVDQLSSKIAYALIELGVRPGDRIGMVLPNTPHFGLAYFGILKAGAAVVAINPQYRPREIAEMVNTSQVKIVFCIEEKLKDLEIANEKDLIKTIISCSFSDLLNIKDFHFQIKRIDFHENKPLRNFIEMVQFHEDYLELPVVTAEEPAVLQFTGGTTGTPKAAVGLHRNLAANTYQFITWCNLQTGQETVLAVIPLYHVYGMVLALCLGIKLGAKIIFWDNPKALEELIGLVEKHQVTFFPGVPSLYNAINQEIKRRGLTPNFQSLKACISGSAPLHAEIKNNFETLTGAKLMEGYGLSEAPTATHCNPLYGENRVGSIGLPLPDVDCQVVDIIDESRSVACGEIGELLIKGPQVMKAYYYNDVETRQSLKNGWLHTGDIVRMDADGYFYVVDRKKSLIKVSGFQVWPNEVEPVIASHPAVQEVGVGGVPEKEHGEKVIAWVVIKKGLSANENDIYAWCRQNLAPYKIPSEIYFKAELPRTSVGKILRRELIRQYLDMKK